MNERLKLVEKNDIIEAILPVTHNIHFMEMQRRQAEKEAGWLVKSAGTLIGDIHPHEDRIIRSEAAFVTTRRLRGTERKLNRSTLLFTQSLELPLDSSDEALNTYFVDRFRSPETRRRLGFIAINEPGVPIFSPNQMSISGYTESDEQGIELAAAMVGRYINQPAELHGMTESREEIAELVARTYARSAENTRTALKSIPERARLRRRGDT